MIKNKPIPLVWLILWAVIIVMFVYQLPAFAGGDIVQSNDNNAQTTGDVNVEGDKGGRAIAWSMGDVDIGQCMYHKGTPVYTWGSENIFCQAQWMIASGYIEAGEHMLCKKTRLAKLYDTYDECRSGLEREVVDIEPPAEPAVDEADNDYEEALVAQQAYLGELESRVAAVESRPKPVSVRREVIQQPYLSDDKKARLRAEIAK